MTNFKQVPTHTLSVGSILKSHIADPENRKVKLLGAGIQITKSFLEKLEARGIGFVEISTRDLALLKSFQPQGRGKKIPEATPFAVSNAINDVSFRIDQLVNDPNALRVGDVPEPMSAKVQRPVDCSYEDGLREQWAEDNDRRIFTITEVAEDVIHGKEGDPGPLEEFCRETIANLMEDADAAVCLGATPSDSEYPTRHSIHVATIAIATGIEIGLGESQLIELGIGCLIHDMGMQKEEEVVRRLKDKAGLCKFLKKHISDHPVHALEIAHLFGDKISDASKMVAYQIHERLDGSGYPRGVKAAQIHTFAKIAAVADTFVALLAPRPHRYGFQGYNVILQLLELGKAGKLDPIVIRGLLQATSLFPIGSCVELNNGHVGRVIRTGETDFANPTIEMWKRDDLSSRPEIINLKHESELKIQSSIPSMESVAGYAGAN